MSDSTQASEVKRPQFHSPGGGWKTLRPPPSAERLFYASPTVSGAGIGASFLFTQNLRLHRADHVDGYHDDPRLRAWLAHLDGIKEPNGSLARELWATLEAFTFPAIPQAGSLPDGGFELVWDREEHHLEIDVLSDRTVEWFYRNRRTEDLAGADATLETISDDLITYLALFE
jgi:hypothetical protein